MLDQSIGQDIYPVNYLVNQSKYQSLLTDFGKMLVSQRYAKGQFGTGRAALTNEIEIVFGICGGGKDMASVTRDYKPNRGLI